MRRVLVGLVLFVVAGCGSGSTAAPRVPLRVVEDIPLPGSTGRFDYMSLDSDHHLLVIAHLADSSVLAFNTVTRRVAWQTPGIGSVHGVGVATDVGRAFASATGTREVVALDEATGADVGRAPTGRFPDGLAYDRVEHTVFISNKDGGTETVVDARTLAPLATIPVGADVGNVQYDDETRTMLVAVGSTNELVTVDAATRRVLGRHALPGCRGAHGVALDTRARRAFVACEGNATVVSVGIISGRVEATQPTGDTPDVLAFDPGLGRLYVAAEDGEVSAYATTNAPLSPRGRSHVAAGAHTVAVDPTTHLVYLALADVGGRPVLRVLAPTG